MKNEHPEVKSLGSYELDERAAILEYDAGMTRKEAEMQALAERVTPENTHRAPV